MKPTPQGAEDLTQATSPKSSPPQPPRKSRVLSREATLEEIEGFFVHLRLRLLTPAGSSEGRCAEAARKRLYMLHSCSDPSLFLPRFPPSCSSSPRFALAHEARKQGSSFRFAVSR